MSQFAPKHRIDGVMLQRDKGNPLKGLRRHFNRIKDGRTNGMMPATLGSKNGGRSRLYQEV